MQKGKVSKKWIWKNYSWIIVLVLFYLWSTVLSELISRSFGTHSGETGFISIFMFILVIIAVITDREWRVANRILWMIGTVVLVILFYPFVSVIMAFIYRINAEKPWLFDRLSFMLAVLPFIIWAMRRSKIFVRIKDKQWCEHVLIELVKLFWGCKCISA